MANKKSKASRKSTGAGKHSTSVSLATLLSQGSRTPTTLRLPTTGPLIFPGFLQPTPPTPPVAPSVPTGIWGLVEQTLDMAVPAIYEHLWKHYSSSSLKISRDYAALAEMPELAPEDRRRLRSVSELAAVWGLLRVGVGVRSDYEKCEA